jgi:hypothetical protein
MEAPLFIGGGSETLNCLTVILRRITCVILRFYTKIFSACTDLRLLSSAFSRALSSALMCFNLNAIQAQPAVDNFLLCQLIFR